MSELVNRLDCTRCSMFTEWYQEEEKRVVRCEECGKRHSFDSLHVIHAEKEYKRSEDGRLLEVTP